jgi:hypothetical protein
MGILPTWSLPAKTAGCFFESALSSYITATSISTSLMIDLWRDYWDLTITSGTMSSDRQIAGIVARNPSSARAPLEFELEMNSLEAFEPAIVLMHGGDFSFPTAWAANSTVWYLNPGRAPGSPALPTPLSNGPYSKSQLAVEYGIIIGCIVLLIAVLWIVMKRHGTENAAVPSEKEILTLVPPPYTAKAGPMPPMYAPRQNTPPHYHQYPPQPYYPYGAASPYTPQAPLQPFPPDGGYAP